MINFLWETISFLQTYNGAVTAIATVFIAAFTIVLALVTNRQAKLTKIAAYAAKTQADAAIGIELPVFLLHHVQFQKGDELCRVWLINQGRTYGVITNTCLAFALTRSLPPKPRYPVDSILEFSNFVDTKQEFTIDRPNSISAEEWMSALKGETVIWIFGYFEYLDFLKATHVEKFCYGSRPIDPTAWKARFGLPTEQEIPHSVSWIRGGPAAYTYSGYKKENEEKG